MAEGTKINTDFLVRKAGYIRKDLVEIAVKNGAEHIAPSLSAVDILTALYYDVMNIPKNTSDEWKERDRFILSKGHGCYGLYSILADKGILNKEDWLNFHKGSFLRGCIERNEKYGLEASCGSLGHGLPMAVGIAFGAKLQNKKYRVYCLVGDGEMQEGSMWEAVQFAVKHKLSNLTMIVDNNGLQAMDFLENVLTPEGRKDDLERKLDAFGFITEFCDGHNAVNAAEILNAWKHNSGLDKPQALIAKTVKGYGLLCMENVARFHFRMPNQEELNQGKRYE